MRKLNRCESGSIRGSLLNLLIGLLFFTAAFFWAWRHWHQAPMVPPFSSNHFSPPRTSFETDPSEATDGLLKALNDELQQMDLLKLLDRQVAVEPVKMNGRDINTYLETFRLPERYSAKEIAARLDPAAKNSGASEVWLASGPASGLANPDHQEVAFTFGSGKGWYPVRIAFLTRVKPSLCLIIDDGGYQRGQALEDLYGFKVPVTVSIIPDVEFSRSLAEEFPSHGVEVMCHLPMEGHEKGEVGNNYQELIKKGMGARQAEQETEKALEGLPNVRGLNNHMGSIATADTVLMEGVCQALKFRHLYAIDSRTTAQSVVEKTARKEGVPTTHRDVFLDNVETPPAILEQLDQAAAYAKKHGTAVAIGHFKEVTLQTLQTAIPKLESQGIQFVFASEVVR